jgi:predicted ATPase/signal transduction histidine kinase
MQSIPDFSLSEVLFITNNFALYRGDSQEFQRTVILKVAVDDASKKSNSILLHEYELTHSLAIDGLLIPFDCQTIDQRTVILFKNADAESLTILLNEYEFDLLQLLTIAKNLAATITAIHEVGIIHKAVTPQNILVNPKSGQTYLINFSHASNLRDTTQVHAESTIPKEGLSYISPELTGWMNRAVDYRTDLYSLGVTLYQLATGKCPFEADDPMELIHAHIARPPTNPCKINPLLNQTVANIILKLLKKTAEERYQSAFALAKDINICLAQLKSKGTITPFSLGEGDIYGRLQIPHRLYGRSPQVNELMASFERARKGEAELMLVAGYSGIGKSALVNEVRKPIIKRHGYFISGKFDQFQRDIPFSAIIFAFQDLVRQLLMLDKDRLEQWRQCIQTALADNGSVITEVVPQIELIIGQQPPVVTLGAEETLNRFNMVMGRFIRLFATADHPLTIFIDDLQWADVATLNFIKNLISSGEYHNLLVLGAYRDNEVNPQHPFTLTVKEIKKGKATVSTITLGPLSEAHLTLMLSDVLSADAARVASLAQLLKEKTDGNPFFAIQFLLMLNDEDLIYIDSDTHQWQWDIEEIQAQALSDNVVDLMAKKVRKLPQKTQNLLRLAACIGTKFKLSTVAVIAKQSLLNTAQGLWPAVSEGLLQSLGDEHKLLLNMPPHQESTASKIEGIDKFLHDRVQQAAYELITEAERQPIHLNIGRELLSNTPNDQLEERIFEIVPHLNKGASLITHSKERQRLAELNLMAVIKAKRSSAWRVALHYSTKGISLLPKKPWQKNNQIAYQLHRENSDCHFRDGQFEEGDRLYKILLSQPISDEQKLSLSNMAIINFATHATYLDRAIDIALDSLKLLDVHLDKKPSQETINKGMQQFEQLIAKRTIASLFDFPPMTSKKALATVETLMSLGPPTFISGSPLYFTSNLQMLFVIAEYGNCPLSAYCYGWQGVIHTTSGNYQNAYQFVRLALRMHEANPNPAIAGRVYMLYNNFGGQWGDSLKKTTEMRTLGFQKAMEVGDLYWGIYNYMYGFGSEVVASENTSTLLQRYDEILKLGSKFHELDHMTLSMQRNVILNLRGTIEDRHSISSELNEEKNITEGYALNLTILFSMQLCQAITYFVNGDYSDVVKISLTEQCATWKMSNRGMYGAVLFAFFESLAILRNREHLDEDIQQQLYQRVDDNIAQFKTWSEVVPNTYSGMYLLLQAEKKSLQSDYQGTIKLYEQAIQSSHENGFLLLEAIANELCADHWHKQGLDKLYRFYLIAARDCYQTWEAYRKVDDINRILENDNSVALNRETTTKPLTDKAVVSDVITPQELDLATIIKTSQSTFSEIDLPTLLENLIRNIVENAGAQHGGILLDEDGELQVVAYISGCAGHEVNIDDRVTRQVFRTGTPTVIEDASSAADLFHDDYIQNHKPKSVLCMPIRHKGDINGVLYLENNLTTGVFDSKRVALLDVLLSQAATAIENTKLFDEKRKLEAHVQHGQKLESLGLLAGGIAHDFNNLLTSIICNTEIAKYKIEQDSKAVEYLEKVQSATRHATTLTNQMLAYAGSGTFKIEPLDINSMIRDLGQLLTTSVSRQVKINYALCEDLPKISADVSQVQQVIMNLVTNAADAIKQHNIENGTVDICSYVGDFDAAHLKETYLREDLLAGQYVCLEVADTGCGMDQATMDKIFDPFFTTKPDGRGLGMAAILGIVRGHKGAISIYSAPGKGTTFKVLFPT